MKNLSSKLFLMTIVLVILNMGLCFGQARVASKLGRYQAMMEKDGYKLATPIVYEKLMRLFYFSLKPAKYRIMLVFDDNYVSNRFCIYPRRSDFSLVCNDGGSENIYDGEFPGFFNRNKPYIELEIEEVDNLMLDLNSEYCKAKECEWALLVYYKN
jgi:hypothetical protein